MPRFLFFSGSSRKHFINYSLSLTLSSTKLPFCLKVSSIGLCLIYSLLSLKGKAAETSKQTKPQSDHTFPASHTPAYLYPVLQSQTLESCICLLYLFLQISVIFQATALCPLPPLFHLIVILVSKISNNFLVSLSRASFPHTSHLKFLQHLALLIICSCKTFFFWSFMYSLRA